MMKSPASLLALPVALALVPVAMMPAAAKIAVSIETVLNMPLGCQIVQTKVLAVTNTTGHGISAGTRISYSFQRYPDHAAMRGSFTSRALAPGQTLKIGLQPAYSCKAWYRRPPLVAQ
jgi:hypothetical protein